MKKFFVTSLLAGTMLFNTANAAPNVTGHQNRETVYQVALLQSLAMGHFNGSITVKKLKSFGDTGIGTFEGLNGEMIVLDGVVYRADKNCKLHVVPDNETVPFSNVTFFDEDISAEFVNVIGKETFESELDKIVDEHGQNSFYVVKVHGDFNNLLVRSEGKQSKPYPTLVEALKDQKEVTCKSISGTIVGLYCPQFMNSLNSVGWHFHFVSDDKKTGGHVLAFDVKRATAQLDKTDNFRMGLPTNKDFDSLNFKRDMEEDIRKAERDKRS